MDGRTLKELDLAVLRHDLTSYGLVAGDVGTVVFVHDGGRAHEVEFMAADGRTIAVETLISDQVDPVSGERILHLRQLSST